jgi:hypothetical protein
MTGGAACGAAAGDGDQNGSRCDPGEADRRADGADDRTESESRKRALSAGLAMRLAGAELSAAGAGNAAAGEAATGTTRERPAPCGERVSIVR